MTEHMNIEQYRKELGIAPVVLGERMRAEDFAAGQMGGSELPKSSERSGKYNAKKTLYNGRMYDSKAEASFAQSLDALRGAQSLTERVVDVQYQVSYPLEVNGQLICRYVADFVVRYADGRVEVVDAKGMKTAIYKLKKKLMRAVHGIQIKENL